MLKPHKTFSTTGRVTEHFSLSEFACHGVGCCGGAAPINWELLERLELLRAAVGVPLHINSGYRCKRYNATVDNASPTSLHMLGIAADIAKPPGWSPLRLATAARRLGLHAITYDWGVHVDLRNW